MLVRRFDNVAARIRCRKTAGSSMASPPSATSCDGLRGEADLVIDTSTLNVHELRARMRDHVRRRAGGRELRSPWCRSASSTGCRSTPTWWWTAGSCRIRTGFRSCAPLTGQDEEVATTCSASRGRPSSWTPTWRLLQHHRGRLRARGQALRDARGGLYRRKHRSVAMSEQIAGPAGRATGRASR